MAVTTPKYQLHHLHQGFECRALAMQKAAETSGVNRRDRSSIDMATNLTEAT